MKDNKKHSKGNFVIICIQVSLLVVTLIVNTYFYSENLKIARLSRRADLSILIDNVEYFVTTVIANITVDGTIRNEGSRATVVKEIRIGISFHLEGDNIGQIVFRHSGLIANLFDWENSTFKEEQTRYFLLSDSTNTQWNSWNFTSPYEGFIQISHDDGISIQEQTKTFSIEQS